MSDINNAPRNGGRRGDGQGEGSARRMGGASQPNDASGDRDAGTGALGHQRQIAEEPEALGPEREEEEEEEEEDLWLRGLRDRLEAEWALYRRDEWATMRRYRIGNGGTDEDELFAGVDNLPTPPEDCAICMEPMTTAVWLPCGYYYHGECVRTWFQERPRPSCSMCRRLYRIEWVDPNGNRPGNGEYVLHAGNVEFIFVQQVEYIEDPRWDPWESDSDEEEDDSDIGDDEYADYQRRYASYGYGDE